MALLSPQFLASRGFEVDDRGGAHELLGEDPRFERIAGGWPIDAQLNAIIGNDQRRIIANAKRMPVRHRECAGRGLDPDVAFRRSGDAAGKDVRRPEEFRDETRAGVR